MLKTTCFELDHEVTFVFTTVNHVIKVTYHILTELYEDLTRPETPVNIYVCVLSPNVVNFSYTYIW